MTIQEQLFTELSQLGKLPPASLQTLFESKKQGDLIPALLHTKRYNYSDIAQIMEKLGYPSAELDNIDTEVAALVTEDQVNNLNMLPYGKTENSILVAIEDPTNEKIKQDIRNILQQNVTFTFASKEVQQKAIEQATKQYELNLAFDEARQLYSSVPEAAYQKARELATTNDTVAHALVNTGAIRPEEAFSLLAKSQRLEFDAHPSDIIPSIEMLSASESQEWRSIIPQNQRSQTIKIYTDHPENLATVAAKIQRRIEGIVTLPQNIDTLLEMLQQKAIKQQAPNNFTEALIQAGKLDESEAKNPNAPEDALKKGELTEEDYSRELAKYRNLPYINPEENPSNPEVMGLIPEHILKDNRAWPHSINEKNELIILISDPRNRTAANNIQRHAGNMSIAWAVAPATTISKLLHSQLTKRQQIEDLTRQISGRNPTKAASTEEDVTDNATTRVINSMIREAFQKRASDIHLEQRPEGLVVRFRIDGKMRLQEIIDPISAPNLLTTIKNQAHLKIEEKYASQSGRIAFRKDGIELNIRVETSRIEHGNVGGEKIVMRLLKRTVNLGSLESLHFHPDTLQAFRHTIHRPYGLILMSGPTGSGKTTTVFTAFKEIATPDKNVLTIEDPVEITLPGISQHQVNPERGVTMQTALRSFLRQDPDIILIGEIRDSETAKTAIEASLTGHLVIASIHSNDAPGAVTRLREMGVEDYNIAASLLGVLSQRLVDRLCTNCRIPYEASSEEKEILHLPLDQPHTLYKPNTEGCIHCNGGYTERVAIHEFLFVANEVREAIAQRQSVLEIARTAQKQSIYPMHSLREDGLWKVGQGFTTRDRIEAAVTSQ